MKGKRDNKSGEYISREREGTHPKERFNIYEQSIQLPKEVCTTFIVGRTTRVGAHKSRKVLACFSRCFYYWKIHTIGYCIVQQL
jgi:hypothetical protein